MTSKTISWTGAILSLTAGLLVSPAWAQPKPALELEEGKGVVKGFGDAPSASYTVRVPKGARADRSNDHIHNYTLDINSMISWLVQVDRTNVASLQAATQEATVPGMLETVEPAKVEGGFEIVKKPTSGAIGAEVWVYRNGRKAQVRARCSGPAKQLAVLREMCGSLKVVE
jgi:hypothetical protein